MAFAAETAIEASAAVVRLRAEQHEVRARPDRVERPPGHADSGTAAIAPAVSESVTMSPLKWSHSRSTPAMTALRRSSRAAA